MRESERVGKSFYSSVHHWLRYNYGKAQKCENKKCAGVSTTYQWAKKQGKEYDYQRENFLELCVPCHFDYDFKEDFRDTARKMNKNTNKTHCKRGHEFKEGSYRVKKGTGSRGIGPAREWRQCNECQNLHSKNYREKCKLKALDSAIGEVTE